LHIRVRASVTIDASGTTTALSLRGKVAAAAMSGLNRAKRLVKHNPALFEMAQRLRSALR
jgi:CelD/BcsL family acetyltransferase involved in cellulose biosynthesis